MATVEGTKKMKALYLLLIILSVVLVFAWMALEHEKLQFLRKEVEQIKVSQVV